MSEETVPQRPIRQTYKKRVIPTADLRAGHLITATGIGLLVEVRAVLQLPGGQTEVTYDYEVAGRRRRAIRRRRTDGRTTIHERLDGAS